MAPIKFDEKLRKKLEERTITPSEMTWDKLDNKLDKLQKKKKDRPFWWLGLAASLVGVLLISNLFFKSDNTTVAPVIVDTKTSIKPKNDVKSVESESKIAVTKEAEKLQKKTKRTTIETPTTVVQNKPAVAATVIKKETPINNNKELTKTESINDNFETDLKTEAVATITKQDIAKFETQKIEEVVAQIQEFKESKVNVTDAEIDSLLNIAERTIFKKRAKNNNTRVVDANSLLIEVENEMDQSFRERVFETIKSGYKTVRTAVVDRKDK